MTTIAAQIDRGRADRHIEAHVTHLLTQRLASRISLQNMWKEFLSSPGVYVVFEGNQLIYVGETGSLRGRMKDLRETRNHTLRRRLGAAKFGDHADYQPAISKRKFPASIEGFLNEYIERKLRLNAVPVLVGRKEIEEWIIDRRSPRFNIKDAGCSDVCRCARMCAACTA